MNHQNPYKSKDEQKNELRNVVNIHLNSIHNEISNQCISEWFSKMCVFKPTYMYTPQKSGRYNANIFEQILNAHGNWGHYYLNTNNSYYRIEFISHSVVSFDANIPIDIWEQNKEELLSFLDAFFVRIKGCFGYIVNYFDDRVIQNVSMRGAVDYCEFWELDDSDFPNIRNIPLIYDEDGIGYGSLDPSYLPGHHSFYGNARFSISPYMWTGPDIYHIISQNDLKGFSECEENIELLPKFRRICLWKNLIEYNHPIYRKRQWDFRKSCNWAENMGDIRQKFKQYQYNSEKANPHAKMEIKTGTFPNGGTLLVRSYFDKKGKPCEKCMAYTCIEREMNGNTIVSEEKKKLGSD